MDYKFYTTSSYHSFILERLKNKVTTRKSRYKMDLYLMGDEYFYTLGNCFSKEHVIAKDISVDIDYDDKGLFIIWKPSASSKTKLRFIIIGR